MPENHYGRSITELVEQHDKDLYRGNGKPGLTIRMEKSEDRHLATERRVTLLEEYNHHRENRLDRKINLLIGAALSLTGTLIAALILSHLRVI